MKVSKTLLITVLIVATSAWLISANDKVQPKPKQETSNQPDSTLTEIKWYDYESGWQKAKAENKHMFVDFTATWCGWCKKMEQTTFQQPAVIHELNTDFVPVQVWDNDPDTLDIDGYKVTVKDLIRKEFRVKGFPALWFVSPQGVRIGPAGGYLNSSRLLNYLELVRTYKYDSTRNESGEKIKQAEK